MRLAMPRARKTLYELNSHRKKTEKLFAAIDNAVACILCRP